MVKFLGVPYQFLGFFPGDFTVYVCEPTESYTDSLAKEAMPTLLDSCPRGMEKIKQTKPQR